MTTIELSEKPRSTFVAGTLMPRLRAFFARWGEARRAAHAANIERIIRRGLGNID